MTVDLLPNMNLPYAVGMTTYPGASPEEVEATRIIDEKVLPEIESLKGVASVTAYGDVEETIRITIKEEKLSSVGASVQNQLEQKFREAEGALNEAKLMKFTREE